MSISVYRFEVPGEDVVVDMRPDTHTVFDLMRFLCETWLDQARQGDGGVSDHMWLIESPFSAARDGQHCGPFGPSMDPNEISETEQQSTLLETLELNKGDSLRVTYDMGSSTEFNIVLKSIETVPGDTKLPRSVAMGDNKYEKIQPHAVPNGGIDLNKVFPHANALLFQSVAQWIIMFACSTDCYGAVEAGPNAMSDMLFMPNQFASILEWLIALDKAGKQGPGENWRPDAYCRLVFPLWLSAEEEVKYQAFKGELDEYEAYLAEHNVAERGLSNLPDNMPEEYIHRFCSAKEVVVRVTEQDVNKVKDENERLALSFPLLCDKAWDHDYWFSFRRGKLILSQGECGRDRGVPRKILAQVEHKITSLQELFCYAEALLQAVETQEVWKKKDEIVKLAAQK